MTKRIVLAGVLGGLALFFWGAFSHMALRLGELGVRGLPQAQTEALKASVQQTGFSYFPAVDSSGKMRPEDEGGANGILIFHPSGASMSMGKQLVTECIVNIAQAMLAAFLLSLVSGVTGFMARAGFVVLAGVMASAAMALEYWNWYGFPTDYTLGMIADRVIGFFIVGLIAAAFVKPALAQPQRVLAKAA